ncbi:hypothetical protein GEV33_003167 [Tenebrio molitor]|uniref:Uncharacterized protein n=1 Tax=Tenebrio molitor TaxID=7067 RepID=A0A8J6LEA7_TENMO|nr:hypothetical protein GEV33_003167 [Tenebrio molitor]
MRKLTRKVQIMGGCTPGTDTVEKGAPELVVKGWIRLTSNNHQSQLFVLRNTENLQNSRTNFRRSKPEPEPHFLGPALSWSVVIGPVDGQIIRHNA